MGKSHFSRFKDGVEISGVSLNVHQKGKVFYVCNSSAVAPAGVAGSDGNSGLTPEHPLSTTAQAITLCTANRGDKIVWLPGHAETLANATALAINVAGLTFIATGEGALKPTFTLSATGSNIPISAANVKILGFPRIIASASSVTAAVTVTAANVELELETADTDATHAMVTGLLTTTAASNIRATLRHRGFAASTVGVRYVDLVGITDADIDIDYFGKSSTSIVDMRTTACNNIKVRGRFYNDSAALTKNVTNNTTSTWAVEGFDAKAARAFAGSDDEAVHYTDSNLSVDSTDNPIGVDDADNAFASTNVVANVDGSVLERLEALMDPLSGYNPRMGFGVTKVSNLADGAGTDNLFTVTGRVLITSLTGEVTTVIGGAATLKIRDITNSVDLCAATTIDSDAVGTMYALTSISANILNGTGATPVIGSIPNITGAVQTDVAIVGDAQAALTLAQVLDAADTGAITWRLTYIPLIAGATVVAAA